MKIPKISGLKPIRKLDLGYPRLLSIMNDTGKCQFTVEPPPDHEDSSHATGWAIGHYELGRLEDQA